MDTLIILVVIWTMAAISTYSWGRAAFHHGRQAGLAMGADYAVEVCHAHADADAAELWQHTADTIWLRVRATEQRWPFRWLPKSERADS